MVRYLARKTAGWLLMIVYEVPMLVRYLRSNKL